MPTVTLPPSSQTTVLVSGANGYVALWIVRVLLERGFAVRGTVRSEAKSSQLHGKFGAYVNGEKGTGRLEVVVVEDIVVEGAFDEALKGVDAVIHTASPVDSVDEADPEVYFQPAVQGTLSILRSAAKYTRIKRVVLTSSAGALLPMKILLSPAEAVVLDERSWGDEMVDLVKKQGREADNSVKYWASKTLAERAAWDFYEANKAQISWDLVVVLPSQAIGPTVQDFTSPTELSPSISIWYDNVFKAQTEATLDTTFVYVDIRDVAQAHVQSLVKEAAAGQRIIVSAGSTLWQATRDKLFAAKPELYTTNLLPRGNPATEAKPLLFLNSKKAEEILDIRYISFQEMNLATFEEFASRGFVGRKDVD